MSLESGKVYKIINYQAGTALDLSARTKRSIIGYNYHNGGNQKWTAEQVEGGQWTLRSVSMGKYIAVDGTAANDVNIIGVETAEPQTFDIVQDAVHADGYRVFVPGTQYNFDLYGGSSAAGTKIVLWTKWAGDNQVWRFEEV